MQTTPSLTPAIAIENLWQAEMPAKSGLIVYFTIARPPCPVLQGGEGKKMLPFAGQHYIKN
jgi:hypothetical protein